MFSLFDDLPERLRKPLGILGAPSLSLTTHQRGEGGLSFNHAEVGSAATVNKQITAATAIEQLGVEYQPIMPLRGTEPLGFEALARFWDRNGSALPPDSVFDQLHDTPELLARLEYELSWHQIAHAPTQGLLFINLDPHAVSVETQHPLLDLLAQRERLVVELIENTDIQDAHASQLLQAQLHLEGVATALDDIGSPAALLSLDLLPHIDYLKFDRIWLQRLDSQPYAELFRTLLAYARISGKQTVLEGVETPAQLARLQAFELDYVQGFLFRDRFVRTEPLRSVSVPGAV